MFGYIRLGYHEEIPHELQLVVIDWMQPFDDQFDPELSDTGITIDVESGTLQRTAKLLESGNEPYLTAIGNTVVSAGEEQRWTFKHQSVGR